MKKKLLTFLTAWLSLTLHASQHYELSNVLPGGQDHHYTANSHILLSPGFKAEPQDGHEVELSIDPYAVFIPTQGLTGGPSSGDDGVVGSLGGSVDIGLLGGATYTIPIELPAGLGKLKPQLAITYNSQAKNGLLGWGWDLQGLSSITRTGQNSHYDGTITAVNYTDDRFRLDGQRLLQVSEGTYGDEGVSYRTEQDQMCKIVSHKGNGSFGTSSFHLLTADGNLLYYGTSSDSKAFVKSSGLVGQWLLKQIKDPYGNEITYHYLNEANCCRLEKITYSGNSKEKVPPFYTIEFNYTERSDVDLTFVGDCPNKLEHLLNGIVISHDGQELYRYQFVYQQPSLLHGYPYARLSEIRFSAGGQHLNPTKIQWSNNNYHIQSSSDIRMNVTTNGIDNAFLGAVKFTGDFNGDGYTDVIATRPDAKGAYTSADLFLNKGAANTAVFDHCRSFPIAPHISWIYTADCNGDGRDDILFVNRMRNPFPLPDNIEIKVYLSKINAQGDLVFSAYDTPPCLIPRDMVEALVIGDFNGDGKASILIQSVKNGGTLSDASMIYVFDKAQNTFLFMTFPDHLDANRFFPADYNGDGVTEILYKSRGETCIAKLCMDDGLPHYQELSHEHLGDWDDCFTGDFNGDGMTDLLLHQSGKSSPWTVFLASKTGISPVSYQLPDNFPYDAPGNYHFSLDNPNQTSHYLNICDLDGNGCSDIALFKDNRFYVFYGPFRSQNGTDAFAYSQQISAQLFNLYSNMEVCIGNFLGQETSSFLGNVTLSHLPPLTHRYEVRRITDGMGRKTELSYRYLMPNPDQPSEDDFYRLSGTNTDPQHGIHCIPLPIRALQQVTTYNLHDKPITTRCRYEGGLLHRHGKGFLGFSKTIQDDYIDQQLQKRTLREYHLEQTNETCHVCLTEEAVYDNQQQLMARTEYANILYSHLKNSKVYMLLTDKTEESYDANHPDQLLKKEISSTTVSTHCSQLFQYNDILSIVQVTKGTTANPLIMSPEYCEYQTTTRTTYHPDLPNQWVFNRPKDILVTIHHEGDENILRQTCYSYDSGHPFQLREQTEIPYQGSQPDNRLTKTTQYDYDPFGNVVAQTVSTPYDSQEARRETFDFSKEYGYQLVTRHTNASGQTTLYQYDPNYLYCTSVTDCNGLLTRFEQDPLGITRVTTHPDQTISCQAIRWEADRYAIWEKKTGQASKLTSYTRTGEPYRVQQYDNNGMQIYSKTAYDAFGRVDRQYLPQRESKESQYILYNYNPHHQVDSIAHVDGTYECIHYDGALTSTTFHTLDGSTQTTSKTTNVMGWTIRSTDANGTSILYDYYADGKPKWSQIEGHEETRIEMAYDGWGNRILLNDPNYGRTTFEYNAFGELMRRTSPKNDRTDYTYDVLGNMIRRVETSHDESTPRVTEWHYHQSGKHAGLLESIHSENQTTRYHYDTLQRLEKTSELILGDEYNTYYTYDQASRVSSITYPSDIVIQYRYNAEGDLLTVLDNAGHPLWKTNEVNALKSPQRCSMGNGVVTEYQYSDDLRNLQSIRSWTAEKILQDYHYEYDGFSNITSQTDMVSSDVEQFTYDPLNRLTEATDEKGTSTFCYDALGRMTSKTDKGTLLFANADYSGPRPHAIKTAETQDGVFPLDRLAISYTSFDKVRSIIEGPRIITYDYGHNQQRISVTEDIDGAVRNKVYVNQCEFISQPGQSTLTRTFIQGPSGVFAVAEQQDGKTSLHYIHKDHLGSWTLITDEQGAVEQEIHFDVWGNCDQHDQLLFDRGYTGHEHIRGIGLINMNGRIYDPVTSSMLSPDNNIQMPDNPQSFNRYAYCINNPLSFTDPDGNTFFEKALLFYVFCGTDFGYELQKYLFPTALHVNLQFSKQQMGIGLDFSFGVPKKYNVSYRTNFGFNYNWSYYDRSYRGWEIRIGSEWCLGGILTFSGTQYFSGCISQTTNAITIGNFLCSFTYENDYMFNLGKLLFGIAPSDNGDRYRTAAARLSIGPLEVGVSIFTGDPGMQHEDRKTFADPDVDGRITYTLNDNGDDPDRYRAGIAYVGLGPVRYCVNSEKIRNFFQNRFAHDFLCQGDTPYFKVLDRPTQSYFYFGTGTGNSLW